SLGGMTPSSRPPLTSIGTPRQPQTKRRRLRQFRALATNPESHGACRECRYGCDAVTAVDSPGRRPGRSGPACGAWDRPAGSLVETSLPARSDCTRSPRPGQRATREGDAHVQLRVVDVLRVEEDAPVEERPAQLGPEVVPHCAGLLVCPRGAGCL